MIIIFDIDGTIADASDRLKHIQGPGKKNWKRFYQGIENDRPIEPMLAVYRRLQCHPENIIYIISGRNIRDAEPETTKWLFKHGLDYAGLYLRSANDYRKDYEFKDEIILGLKEKHGRFPDIAFEDSPAVIDQYRSRGIFTLDVAQTPHADNISNMIFQARER